MKAYPFAPTESASTLIILEQERTRSVNLRMKSHWTLGRLTDIHIPDIPLQSPIASQKHGEFFYVKDQLFYVDRGSKNGTFHNGKKIAPGLNGRANPVMINNRDVLRIDYEDLHTPDTRGVWMMIILDDIAGEWRYYPLGNGDGTVSYRNVRICDIDQPFSCTASQETKIFERNRRYYISAGDSVEYAFLNGKKLISIVELKESDCIALYDRHFIFTGSGLIYNTP